MSENMAVYYDSEESKYNNKNVDTDTRVKTYSVDNKMEYPYLMLESDEMPGYKAQVISNTLEKKKFIQDKTPESYYNVYITMQGQIVGLGMIHSDGLKNILLSDLYKGMGKYLMLTPELKVEGEMMYSYCTSPLY